MLVVMRRHGYVSELPIAQFYTINRLVPSLIDIYRNMLKNEVIHLPKPE